jgi:hypothetical protein
MSSENHDTDAESGHENDFDVDHSSVPSISVVVHSDDVEDGVTAVPRDEEMVIEHDEIANEQQDEEDEVGDGPGFVTVLQDATFSEYHSILMGDEDCEAVDGEHVEKYRTMTLSAIRQSRIPRLSPNASLLVKRKVR